MVAIIALSLPGRCDGDPLFPQSANFPRCPAQAIKKVRRIRPWGLAGHRGLYLLHCNIIFGNSQIGDLRCDLTDLA